jgi:methylmalonyl-CoA mutase, C-terminal domain
MILFGGGIMSEDEVRDLESRGISKLYGPGTPTGEIIAYIKEAVAKKRANEKVI